MSRDSALWIGGVSLNFLSKTWFFCSSDSLFQVEKYMTEDFLKKALSLMGEEGVVSVKVL